MICYCASPQCQKYGCRQYANIPPPANMGYASPVQTGAKPHKCPVCEGFGRRKLVTAQCDSDVVKCHACINGVVWG